MEDALVLDSEFKERISRVVQRGMRDRPPGNRTSLDSLVKQAMKSKPITATGISAKQLRVILKEQAAAAGYIVVKDYDKRYSKNPSGQKKRTWIEVPTQVPEVDPRATLRSHVNQVVNDIMGKAHPGLGVSVPGIMRLVLNIPECKQHYESDMQQLEDDVCDVAESLGFHIVEYLDELFLVREE
ncbi:MAG: hypothetical protein WC083_05070 [Candidatus Methanomethylophilaceae archaeon]